ncbi:MAG: hypothetical protein WBE11_14095 [Candidatus Aminicenantaceae bacterium]
MKIFKSNRWMGLLISLVFLFSIFVTFSTAQEKIKAAGKMTLEYTEQHSIDVADSEGHILSIGKMEGINVSTGENKFMDGAKAAAVDGGDYVGGNGPNYGYGKLTLNGDVVFWKIEGKIITTLSPDGTPITTFEGTYTVIKGAGQYENIQGSGTYKGKLISATKAIYEWEGEYFIKK